MLKNKFHLLSSVLLLLVLVFSACKSAPPAKEPEAPPAPVVQEAPAPAVKPVDAALTALRDKAEALRNEGLKYGLNTYKADDWSKADASRDAGLKAYGTDYDLSQKSFEDAISRYEAIRKDSYDAISLELEAQINKAREAAITAGAQDYYPEQFARADEAKNSAFDYKAKSDFPNFYDVGQVALMRFKTLQNGMIALDLKKKIDEYHFVQYAPTDYDAAEAKYQESATSYGSADAASYEASSSAIASYKIVTNAGFKALSQELAVKVEDARAQCVAIKAQKSAKESFGKAEEIYSASNTYAKADNWESAYFASNDALNQYTAIYQDVSLKKNAADVAIAQAKNRQAESTELAKKADEKAPLPENAQGYSEELPVLEEAASTEVAK